MKLRIFAFVILFISIIAFPLWVSAVLAFLGMLYFSFFIEAVILFLISDVLYRVPETELFNMIFISFFVSFTCLIIIELTKRKLRFK